MCSPIQQGSRVRLAGSRGALTPAFPQVDPEGAVVFGGIGLGDHQPPRLEQDVQGTFGLRGGEGPEVEVRARQAQGRCQQVTPAADRRLAHLLRTHRPEKGAGSASFAIGFLASAAQALERDAQLSGEVLALRPAGSGGIKGALQADLCGRSRGVVEIAPFCLTQPRQDFQEGDSPNPLGVSGGQTDGEVETSQDQPLAAGSRAQPVEEGRQLSDLSWRADGILAAGSTDCLGHPAFLCAFAPVGMDDQVGELAEGHFRLSSNR